MGLEQASHQVRSAFRPDKSEDRSEKVRARLRVPSTHVDSFIVVPLSESEKFQSLLNRLRIENAFWPPLRLTFLVGIAEMGNYLIRSKFRFVRVYNVDQPGVLIQLCQRSQHLLKLLHFLLGDKVLGVFTKLMDRKNMETSDKFMALDCFRATVILKGEVLANSTGTITQKRMGLLKRLIPTSDDVDQIIKCRDKNPRWTHIRRKLSIVSSSRPMELFNGEGLIDFSSCRVLLEAVGQ